MANTFRYVTSTNPMETPLNYEGDANTRTLTLADIEPRRLAARVPLLRRRRR
ncbi:MAG: hypothetical protein R3A52_15120 [Polyangiales bacterium]